MGDHARADVQRHLWDSLVSSVESRLSSKSHLDITSRDIAEGAGTHPSMVNYYFNSKDDLFSAIVDAVVSKADDCFRQIESDIDAKAGDPTEIIVRGLVRAYPVNAPGHSIGLIEVFRQGSKIKEAYARRRKTRVSLRIEKQIRKLIARGDYRRDLDPVSTASMILCLVFGRHIVEAYDRALGSSGQLDTENWVHTITEMIHKYVAVDQ